MLTKTLYSAIGVCFAMVTVIMVLDLVAGVAHTLGIGVLVLFVGVVPPAIVFRWSAARALKPWRSCSASSKRLPQACRTTLSSDLFSLRASRYSIELKS